MTYQRTLQLATVGHGEQGLIETANEVEWLGFGANVFSTKQKIQ